MTLLVIDDVRKSFGSVEVLRGIDLEVSQSEVSVLIGASGSGKSTLLRCVNALEQVDSGRILLSGQELATKPAEVRHWREQIGFVFQSFNLFPHLAAQDNIALPLRLVKDVAKADARAAAMDLLHQVGLGDKGHSYPDELSGGQQQRVAIARALALRPQLMMFDEPTSALDPELTGEVLDVMAQLASEGMTMLVVSHELRFVRRLADVVYFMHDGGIHEWGPPERLFNEPETPECQKFLRSIAD